jgi:hypothetical protein
MQWPLLSSGQNSSSKSEVFSAQSERWPCDATKEELLEALFSVRSVTMLYKDEAVVTPDKA